MNILVIAEHDNEFVKPSTLHAVTAAAIVATFTHQEVHVLVAGNQCRAAADVACRIAGVTKVLYADAPQLKDGLAENVESTIVGISEQYNYVLVSATAYGKNIAPRVAARLDVAQISDAIAVSGPDTFDRPIYAGNAIATVQSLDSKKIITVRTTGFDAASASGGNATIVEVGAGPGTDSLRFIDRQVAKLERPELTDAKIVVSGGRGLGSGENYARVLEPLASKLGAAMGASRAAVDAGYVPNDYQVGQTGKIVAPQVYFAVGISGAIQHLAGMKDSKVIVAINKDPEAPIFSVADYGLEADLFDAVPQLVDEL